MRRYPCDECGAVVDERRLYDCDHCGRSLCGECFDDERAAELDHWQPIDGGVTPPLWDVDDQAGGVL